MRYSVDDFIRTINAVEEQGGEHLEDICQGDEVKYAKVDGSVKAELTYGCMEQHKFRVLYDPSDTVLVPEPMLERDPSRSSWTDEDGNTRETHRTKTEKMPDGTNRPLLEYVEREGDRLREDTGEGGTLRDSLVVCGMGDNVGMWPRFRHAIQDEATG